MKESVEKGRLELQKSLCYIQIGYKGDESEHVLLSRSDVHDGVGKALIGSYRRSERNIRTGRATRVRILPNWEFENLSKK